MVDARRKFLLLATTIYVAAMVALGWGMFALRNDVLNDSNAAKARDDWQQWRSEVERQQQEPQAVARRVPKSEEPPALVLMRDYFVTCLVGAVVFVSLVYWVLAGLLVGATVAGDLRSPTAATRRSPAS